MESKESKENFAESLNQKSDLLVPEYWVWVKSEGRMKRVISLFFSRKPAGIFFGIQQVIKDRKVAVIGNIYQNP